MKKLEIQKLHIDISIIKYINKVESKTTESQMIKAIITLNLSLYSRKRCVKTHGRINQWY